MENDKLSASGSQAGISCSLYRGGTSKGVLLLSRDLPYPRDVVNQVLLTIFGSPDKRQIDGLGGGNSQTSKAMLIDGPGPGHDVQMTFAQVAVDSLTVDWGGNCGNMTAAVGPFAIDVGLVAPVEPVTVVRILSANTGLRVAAHVPVRDGVVVTDGEFSIPGVPGTGARIDLEWFDPAGSVTRRLLPTGKPRDRVRLSDGTDLDISIVDAANPVAFCEAAALGLAGTELPEDFETRPHVLAALEEVRGIVAEMIGIVPSRGEATRVSPGLPKVAVVAPPSRYRTTSMTFLDKAGHDLQARLMSMQTPHRSLPVSGGICAAAAAAIEGTVVHSCLVAPFVADRPFRIAHPCGVMDVRLEITTGASEPQIRSARVGRTARRIMSGLAYVPASLLREATRLPMAGGAFAARR